MKKTFLLICTALMLSSSVARATLFAAETPSSANNQIAAITPDGRYIPDSYVGGPVPAPVDGTVYGSRLIYFGAAAVFVAAVATTIILTQTDSPNHSH